MTKQGKSEVVKQECHRLYEKGDFVVLVAGKNCCFDELFLFEQAADAERFYETDFREWESFRPDEEEGMGFQEVSLYLGGRRVSGKDAPPSKRSAGLEQHCEEPVADHRGEGETILPPTTSAEPCDCADAVDQSEQ